MCGAPLRIVIVDLIDQPRIAKGADEQISDLDLCTQQNIGADSPAEVGGASKKGVKRRSSRVRLGAEQFCLFVRDGQHRLEMLLAYS